MKKAAFEGAAVFASRWGSLANATTGLGPEQRHDRFASKYVQIHGASKLKNDKSYGMLIKDSSICYMGDPWLGNLPTFYPDSSVG